MSVEHSQELPAIGWVGLGAMGLPMASVAVSAGLAVTAYDVSEARLTQAVAAGAVAAASAADVAANADIVAVVVATPDQLRAVLFGASGIADHLRTGAVLAVFSTVGPDTVVEVARELRARGVEVLDTPCSGGVARAEAGELMVTVSGSAWARRIAAPLLDALATSQHAFGDQPGDGQRVKLVNQLLCGVHIAAAGEALAFAEALGLDAQQCFDALCSGAAASFMFGDRGQRMLHPGNEVRSAVSIFVKDMGLVTQAAEEIGYRAPLSDTALHQFQRGAELGLGPRDDSSVIEVYRSGGPVE